MRLRLLTITAATLLTPHASAQIALSNQDDCANATMDVVGPGFYQASTVGATTGTEGQNEAACDEAGSTAIQNDIWFVYRPSTTGRAVILACGFGPTTGGKVAVWPGTGCPVDGTSIACDGQSCTAQGGGAFIEMPVTFGTSHLIQLGNTVNGGSFNSTIVIIEQLGFNYCTPAVPNSTGDSGTMSVTGSGTVATNDVTLSARNLPPGQFGYFLVSRTQGSVQPPGSQGILCLSGNIGRYNAPAQIFTGPTGTLEIDLGTVPVNPPTAVLPGETWNFQAWYRDEGNTSNFTDAVSVAFQ
ncbi:MAG: hypothetical protein GY711_00810 [bacterium]|nr:hypothetical protein [bacterium]